MEWRGSGVLTPALAAGEVSLAGSDGSAPPGDEDEGVAEPERHTSSSSEPTSPTGYGADAAPVRRGVPAVRRPVQCQVPACGERIEPGPSGRSYCFRYRCVAAAWPRGGGGACGGAARARGCPPAPLRAFVF